MLLSTQVLIELLSQIYLRLIEIWLNLIAYWRRIYPIIGEGMLLKLFAFFNSFIDTVIINTCVY